MSSAKRMEIRVPKFVPTRISTATTYHFKIDPPDAFGWALCTVNDGTGELLITSDYGNWSHRWSADPKHLGHPTLTHFIGERAGCDYLADKLTKREDRERFDAHETVKHMQRMLCERRLEQGRALIDWYRDEDPEDRIDVGDDWLKRTGGVEFREVWAFGDKEHWPLTKSSARYLFRELGKLDASTVEGFVEAFNEIDGHEWISVEPWHEDLRYRPDTSYRVLVEGILPALVEACAAEVKRRAQPASFPLPPVGDLSW